MMNDWMDASEFRRIMRQSIKLKYGLIRNAAQALNVERQTLSNILNGRYGAGKSVLTVLGWEKQVMYRRLTRKD